MTSAFNDDYPEGAIVQCQRCAKNIRVKYFDRDSVVIVSTQEQQTLALRCQNCGFVLCDSCAHPADSLFPVCPSCQREWGPYYFTHDAIKPSTIKTPVVDNVDPVIPSESLPASESLEPEPASEKPDTTLADTLASGDVDFFRDEFGRNRNKILRKILILLIFIFLVVAFVYIGFSQNGARIRKGLSLLSSRPTRTATALSFPTSVLKSPTPRQVVTPTTKKTPTHPKLSATIDASGIVNSSQDTEVVPSATRTPQSASATFTSTATYTITSTPVSTEPNLGNCVPALSVTLDDVGKTMCVKGVVVFTTQKENAFSIYFSEEEGHFRIIVYDRVPKGVEEGVCVQVTGEIKTLLNSPVIAPGYKDEILICTQ